MRNIIPVTDERIFAYLHCFSLKEAVNTINFLIEEAVAKMKFEDIECGRFYIYFYILCHFY